LTYATNKYSTASFSQTYAAFTHAGLITRHRSNEGKYLLRNQTNPNWLNRKINHECEYEDSSCNPAARRRDWTRVFLKILQ